LRNLIAHYSGRVTKPRALQLLENAKMAFPKIEFYADDYVLIESDYASELQFEVEEFIRNMAELTSGVKTETLVDDSATIDAFQ
jgi:hypothetical protein